MGKPKQDPLHVRVGQVWADNDPRNKGRTLRIERIHDDAFGESGGKAECRVMTHPNAKRRQSATVLIALSRFKDQRNGYSLVSEPSVIGKSARLRAEQVATAAGMPPGSPGFYAVVDFTERHFREHARDQRHLCAGEVPYGVGESTTESEADARMQALADAHSAVLNAPEPGKSHG